MKGATTAYRIHINGIVQGVGFRPFVYSLAKKNHLTGWVMNSSSGVDIEIIGSNEDVARFVQSLQSSPPPLARIDQFETCKIDPDHHEDFVILESKPQPGAYVPVSPDVSICEDCRNELFDPDDRRYRYPFINCTNCGPRFTIIQDVPYDRPLTTMSSFPMCPQCRAEYGDPLNRRFHAQPIACPNCGPQIQFVEKAKAPLQGEDALQSARKLLAEGKILAVKGLGGYHLACDGCNHKAVETLRFRKKRTDKPFAMMAYDLSAIEAFCEVGPQEKDLLSSRQHPIVLLAKKQGSCISPLAAPNQTHLGMMLPYTPLHLLLLEPAEGFPEVLIMTSGNVSEEPIAYTDEEAFQRLSGIADGYLLHNRPIHMRTDDSVAQIAIDRVYLSRRSRGYAPDPLPLPFETPPILATGPELKNTFCLGRNKYAFLSHHIGDLENFETLQSFEQGISHFENLFKIEPEIIACDLHPDFLATRYAEERAAKSGIPIFHIQHHHAHLAACLADNGWPDDNSEAIGVIMDGTGLGTDGAIWGGEFLLGNYSQAKRVYHLEYMPLPGGDTAIRKPARTTLAYLWKSGIQWSDSIPSYHALSPEETAIIYNQLHNNINVFETSSMGRLFDVVSSILGVCHSINYEGQAAIELENIISHEEMGKYPFQIKGSKITVDSILRSVLEDLQNGVDRGIISSRFHNSIAGIIVAVCNEIRQQSGISHVVLSGGVWQNQYLLSRTIQQLRVESFQVLWNKQLPPNDGCVSVGQLAVAAALQKKI